MINNIRIVYISLIFSLSIIVMSPVNKVYAIGSGGYENQVPGARAMGRANAVVASVDDASAVFFNPARLAGQGDTKLSIGFTGQNLSTDYDNQAGTTDSLESDTAFTPNFFTASNFGTSRWGFGLGVNIPDGITTEWSKSSPLRFIATKTSLVVLDVNPGLGFMVTEKFSIGAGLNYYNVTNVESNKQINVTNLNAALGGSGAAPEGSQKLKGDGNDLGANIGLAFSPNEINSFGVSYRSGAAIDVEGDVELHNLTNESAALFGTDYKSGVESKVYVPPSLQLGYAYRPSQTAVLEIDAQWNKWSVFNDQNVKFKETDPTRLSVLTVGNPVKKDWRNSWSVGLGSEFIVKQNVALRAGYAFFDSPIPNETFEASTPDSDLHMFTLGAGYNPGNFSYDLAFQYFKLNKRKINNDVGASDGTTGNGTYKSSAIYYAFNVGYKFGKD